MAVVRFLTRTNNVLAVVFGLLSISYLVAARGYRLGTLANPGPRLFPVILGSALLVCSLLLVAADLSARRRFARPGGPPPSLGLSLPKDAGRRVLAFSAVAVVYPLVAGLVGFEAATALGLAGMSFVMGERRPGALAALALLGSAVCYVVFRRWLGVPLP